MLLEAYLEFQINFKIDMMIFLLKFKDKKQLIKCKPLNKTVKIFHLNFFQVNN